MSVGINGEFTGVNQVYGCEGKVDRCEPGLWV